MEVGSTITGRLVQACRSVGGGEKSEGSVDHRSDLRYQPEEITGGGSVKGRRA